MIIFSDSIFWYNMILKMVIQHKSLENKEIHKIPEKHSCGVSSEGNILQEMCPSGISLPEHHRVYLT